MCGELQTLMNEIKEEDKQGQICNNKINNRDKKYSIGNLLNNTVISLHGDSW